MLTQEQNDLLTRVGPGTPMGKLMRRYWHPIATCHELKENPVKAVRILGESLTLFRDRQGHLGLIGQRCAHRRVDLRFGIPEANGLRCPYHGWLYDRAGRCLEQPAEIAGTDFQKSIKLPSYPAEELGGLVWTYLGPEPRPLLPRWDLFVEEHAFRMIGTTDVPCNWLQCQENAVDTVHTEWAHGRLAQYAIERKSVTDPRRIEQAQRFRRHHLKIDFAPVEVGIQKRRLVEGQSEDAEEWRTGHPMVFPNYVRIGQLGYSEFQIRVPLDDTHTWHLAYHVYFPGEDVEVPKQDPVPAFNVPIQELPEFVLGQDLLCWAAQGEICDRTQEQLGVSDRGLVMFRKLLMEQIEVVEMGGDPINTIRDPAKNKCISLSLEDRGDLSNYRPGSVYYNNTGRNSPVLAELDALMMKGAAAAKARALKRATK
ncbi:MAG TPA: Rieske 2Fe-2S domain-containing protein [Stellaceae bacterium]|nr:Rieske 2Fe-2S domain-containing protein [Stellaceae bacterium]